MDKNAIKKFATEARRELMARVSQRALLYGISPMAEADPEDDVVEGRLLSSTEKRQRAALIEAIKEKSYDQVIEEVAYTWFNRFCALRFMEVNGYLPGRVRVFTDENNAFKPQILAEAIHLEMEGLDREKVFAYKEADANDDLYKYLLITQCNALSGVLPKMFQKIADATELLFPDNLLREGNVLYQMIETIPEEDWKDAVQIIGWLYQYYNSEKKDEVNASLEADKAKVSKENIPAITQLFTPDWIVRYMVENSLGRLWVEGHPDEALKSIWKYYLDEAEQEPEVEEKLEAIRKVYREMKPEDIRCIDPCCGSGHILAYLFDVLVQIYESCGYRTREAVESIVKNNLYGLDIDERAAQLAYFSVMMKARQYDRSFFNRGIQPHVHAIEESNKIDPHAVDYFCGGDEKLSGAVATIVEELHDAKEYGSIISVSPQDWDGLFNRFHEIKGEVDLRGEAARKQLLPLVKIAQVLAQKYDVVVTNPPYMGSKKMNAKLSEYLNKNYPDSKSDLFAVFIERCEEMSKKYGYRAMITQHGWMFMSSFEELRKKLLAEDIINMAHLGARAFEEISGEVVQTTSFVIRKSHIADFKGEYCRLIEPTTQQGKEDMFLDGNNRYAADQNNFSKMPGSQFAYWVGDNIIKRFGDQQSLFETRAGITTGGNNYFLKNWHEVNSNHIYRKKQASNIIPAWYFHHKGGKFRKWYGNLDLILQYDAKAINEMKTRSGFRHDGKDFYFIECGTWNKTGTGDICVRYSDDGNTFNTGGCCLFTSTKPRLYYSIGLLNSKVMRVYLSFLCPTSSFTAGDVAKVPVVESSNKSDRIYQVVQENINLAHDDWDSFETSWDFKEHPLLRNRAFTPEEMKEDLKHHIEDLNPMSEAYHRWKDECYIRFTQLKANEEELNRIFIDIYGLQDELTPEVADKDITVYRVFDAKEDVPESMAGSRYVRTKEDEVVSFISYAVGCMFGRYSPDVEGLAYAGGEWDESKYRSYPADRDNIIPISDDVYFEDDILSRFVKFVEVVYGESTLEENLAFIAEALGGKGQPRDVIRNYFLKRFFKDHCKTYHKRPIYWLFDSGKKNGFKCLIYMHRYSPDTIARIRTDYVHEQQARYRSAIADLETRMEKASSGERVKLSKKLKAITDQAKEVQIYEEKIHHLADQMIAMDLDDGVKMNYAKFQDVLAKIK